MATKKSTKATLRERRGAAKSSATAPAYFLSLTVENVRCFGLAQTLDLSDGNGRHARWTIILGENGTGKTALLRLLARSAGDRPCFGYGATRSINLGLIAEDDRKDVHATLLSDHGWLINTERILASPDSFVPGERDIARRRLPRTRDALLRILPDVSGVKLGGRNERVGFKTSCGWVDLEDMSLGQTTLIAWVVDFITRLFDRYPNSPNPLAEPAVCLVDEIDLRLHPAWQRKIASRLTEAFPNTQFIVTAHSPLVVQSATDANIVVLRREGDHVVIDNSVESLKGWSVDQILTSDLYGLASERPPEFDDVLAERQRLLSKPELTSADKRRLRSLEAKVEELPVGSTPEDIKAFDLVRRFAADLKRKGIAPEAPASGGTTKKAAGKKGSTKRAPGVKSGAKKARAKR